MVVKREGSSTRVERTVSTRKTIKSLLAEDYQDRMMASLLYGQLSDRFFQSANIQSPTAYPDEKK
jgi:hypothetical protein